jgi:prophage maintenance system killer protein
MRDLDSLRAAVARPWGTSFGRDHFPTPFDKAAALAESIIRRHLGKEKAGAHVPAFSLTV